MHHADKGDKFDVDLTVKEARPKEFDALMIPRGLVNPDELRRTPEALELVRHFFFVGEHQDRREERRRQMGERRSRGR